MPEVQTKLPQVRAIGCQSGVSISGRGVEAPRKSSNWKLVSTQGTAVHLFPTAIVIVIVFIVIPVCHDHIKKCCYEKNDEGYEREQEHSYHRHPLKLGEMQDDRTLGNGSEFAMFHTVVAAS